MRIDRDVLNQVARLKLVTPRVAVGPRQGERHSPYVGRGVDFADYRPYQPGDDLRLVDWNVFSRLEMILVRLFHEDRNLSVQVCIDASGSMAFGEPRKIDHAGALGASLALVALLNRDETTIGCAGGSGPLTVVRGANRNGFAKVIRYLEMVDATGIENPLKALKAQVRGSKPDRLFYISDMLKEPKDLDRLLRVLSASARRPCLLHVLGDTELTPELRTGLRVIDGETEEEIRVPGGRLGMSAYEKALAEYLDDIQTRCRSLRVQYVPAFTTVDVPELLNGVMRRVRVVQSASGATR